MIDLERLAEARQKLAAGAKCIMQDGTNQAMFRDNGLDVLEELADALNIIQLWRQRLDAATIEDVVTQMDIPWRLDNAAGHIRSVAYCVNKLRDRLPAVMRSDLIPVERILPAEQSE